MKLVVDRDRFHTALSAVNRACDNSKTIPILSNAYLSAVSGELTIRCTDLTKEISACVEADISSPGEITVSAANLTAIIAKTPSGASVSLEDGGDGRLVVRSGRSRSALATLPATDFPSFSSAATTASFVLPAKTLAGMIKKTAYAMSDDKTRYYLAGVFIHHDDKNLMVAATSGYVMAQAKMEIPDGASGLKGVIIPDKSVVELLRLASASEGDVQISASDTRMSFLFPNKMTLSTKLMEGTYPDYQRVIPVGYHLRCVADKDALVAIVERVSILASENRRCIKMELRDEELKVSAINPDAGDSRDEMDVEWQGEPLEISFNASYLLSTLNAIDADRVMIEFGDAGSPALLRAMTAPDAVHVLMPMRG